MPVFSPNPTDAEITRARVFDEPLVPATSEVDAGENTALAGAIRQYLQAGGGEAVRPFTEFLGVFPQSRWRPVLMVNLGIVYRRTGHFSRALAAWDEAWTALKSATAPSLKAPADRAVGELFELNARLGRFDVLERLFEAIEGRDIRGSATEKVSGARQALWLMTNRPEESFRCGPLAIDQILRLGRTEYESPEPIRMCKSTRQGTSLAQLCGWRGDSRARK
jgi:hypothetical protein